MVLTLYSWWRPGQLTVRPSPQQTLPGRPAAPPARAAPVATTSGPHAAPAAGSARQVRDAGIFMSHPHFLQFLVCRGRGEGGGQQVLAEESSSRGQLGAPAAAGGKALGAGGAEKAEAGPADRRAVSADETRVPVCWRLSSARLFPERGSVEPGTCCGTRWAENGRSTHHSTLGPAAHPEGQVKRSRRWRTGRAASSGGTRVTLTAPTPTSPGRAPGPSTCQSPKLALRQGWHGGRTVRGTSKSPDRGPGIAV